MSCSSTAQKKKFLSNSTLWSNWSFFQFFFLLLFAVCVCKAAFRMKAKKKKSRSVSDECLIPYKACVTSCCRIILLNLWKFHNFILKTLTFAIAPSCDSWNFLFFIFSSTKDSSNHLLSFKLQQKIFFFYFLSSPLAYNALFALLPSPRLSHSTHSLTRVYKSYHKNLRAFHQFFQLFLYFVFFNRN